MIALALLACREDPPPTGHRSHDDYDPVDWVDPFVGTGGIGAQTTGVGPHAQVPFGMTSVGPDTRDANGSQPSFYHYGGYHWEDSTLDGFSHTHSHGMGVVDFGGVEIMPRAHGWAPALTTSIGRLAPFDHAHEAAGPGWYAVDLQDDGTAVAIAATRHGALHRYTFPAGSDPVVVLDLGHVLPGVEIGPDSTLTLDPTTGEITGFQRLSGGYSGHFGGLQTSFVLEVDPAPSGSGTWSDPAAPQGGSTAASGSTAGAWLQFPAGTAEVSVRAALSYVDLDGARGNLATELPDTDWEGVRDRAVQEWRDELANVHVWGGVPDEDTVRTIFHTAQYHTMMMPRTFADVDGRYRGLDGQVHAADFAYVTDLSLWDTYRTLNPWLLLTRPDRERDVLRSLVRMTEDGGALPRWPLGHGYTGGMVGSPGTIVYADAALKGLDGWDQESGYAASVAQATGPTYPVGRGGIEDWTTLGWVTAQDGAGASLTLEYAWADYALAGWGDALGHDASAQWATSAQWRNTWDPAVGFFQARNADGTFTPFEGELSWSDDYVEGDAWHYLWTVPYDVDGMIEVQHGGDREAFYTRYADYWQKVYDEPDDPWPDDYYWHGNEPVLHYAWLGSLAGRTDLTAEAERWVALHRYAADPVGLDGNDDAGTLSAWYLWAALGVYPVSGTDRYAVGAPLVEHAEIQTEQGTLVVDAPDQSAENLYPTRVEVDGEPVGGEITHDRLAAGHLVFHLSASP